MLKTTSLAPSGLLRHLTVRHTPRMVLQPKAVPSINGTQMPLSLTSLRHCLTRPSSRAPRLMSTSTRTPLCATQAAGNLQPRLALTSKDFEPTSSLLVGIALFRYSPKLQLLVLKRAATEDLFPNCWAVPGGHVDANETVKEGLAREMQEETGLVITKALEEFKEMEWCDAGGKKGLQLNFIVDVQELEGVKLRREEHETWIWADEEEVKGLFCSEKMAAVFKDAFQAAKARMG